MKIQRQLDDEISTKRDENYFSGKQKYFSNHCGNQWLCASTSKKSLIFLCQVHFASFHKSAPTVPNDKRVSSNYL